MELIISFPSEIEILPFDPVFSNLVNFNKKVSIINCSTISKSFKAIGFSFRFLAFITFCQLLVGYVLLFSFLKTENVMQFFVCN